MDPSTLTRNQSSVHARKSKAETQQKKLLLTLLLRHLDENGYAVASEALEKEAATSMLLPVASLAPNMNLMYILHEFEEFYQIKMDRAPVLVRRLTEAERRNRSSGAAAANADAALEARLAAHAAKAAAADEEAKQQKLSHDETPVDMGGMKVRGYAGDQSGVVEFEERLMKPLPSYADDPDMRDFAQLISRDIFTANPNVHWNDVAGLDVAKRLLKEAVVMPIKYPQLFHGILKPWKGMLLYGPPGTGKTLLAKAVATECRTTFFNISASSITSKWRGDSEKLVRVLFELARHHAPSTIFIDEIDSIMGQRGVSEHEGARRMKTEVLIQMEGLAKTDDLVFVLAATNLPWDLDFAMLRRLEKRVYIPLPDLAARRTILQHYLGKRLQEGPDGEAALEECAASTDGYSGADLRLLCKEAAMHPLRSLLQKLEGGKEVYDAKTVKVGRITTTDLKAARSKVNASGNTLAEKYIAWQKEFKSS
eukprot:INCI8822.1.p1 GENE.INCI8822.1~~INCI8822.1.p1  ORF type:complete len:481 (-),score=94.71 INCI8822.1:293-1735(-)